MLNRSQIYTMIAIRNRPGSVFNPKGREYRLPIDVIQKIANVGFDADPNSDIAKLLHHIAYGNLTKAKKMLHANPRLVLHSAHTETPSGLKVLHTTPLECALGAGDPEMAQMIESYFNAKEIEGGVKVRDEQLARYRQHVEDMLSAEKNPPYDFTLLIDTLMAATPEDVTAALNLDFNRESVLRDVLAQFRKDFTPGTITSGMHFNYLHLLRAFEVYEQKFNDLFKSGGNAYDKLRLFSRQVIGFIQRSSPAIDRMVFAQGLYDVVANKAKIERSFKFNDDNADFPVTAGDSSRSALGYEYWVASDFPQACPAPLIARWIPRILENLCRAKISDLQNLCGSSKKRRRLGV
jgi:hypothetical protein